MKYLNNLTFFVQKEFISQYYNKLSVSLKLIKGSNINKTEKNILLMIKRSRCVFDCETQRHLYQTPSSGTMYPLQTDAGTISALTPGLDLVTMTTAKIVLTARLSSWNLDGTLIPLLISCSSLFINTAVLLYIMARW